MKTLIGLTGLAGSGKSTAARYLVTQYGFVPVSFADGFKIPMVARGELSVAVAFGGHPRTDEEREWMQRRGTEEGRDVHGEDIWVRHANAQIQRLRCAGVVKIVLDDVRFPNEAAYVMARGGHVWRLTGRGGLGGLAADHPSETSVRTIFADVEIDNSKDAPRALFNQIDHLMRGA